MSNLKFSFGEIAKRRAMFFSKSITIDDEELGNVAMAAGASTAYSSVESEFIERLKQGDPAAFDTLANRYASDIYGLLYRLTQDVEEASDLTQETFLSALKAISKFRGEADLKTWLFRIAINESRNRFRWWKRRRRDVTISLDVTIGESETPLSETFSSDAPNPEERALRGERERLLRDALNDLPDIFREAVVLCDIEGFSYEEIAQTLEVNMGTVKSRIARGRDELRRKLEGI
jgi:RNA polymerase sigma-70 factor (ECF subfamily)